MKHIANYITCTRIVIALLILFIKPMSPMFWVLYSYCILSDILDGYIARKKNTVNDCGALLDSIADIVFFCSIAISVLSVITIPAWIAYSTLIVASLRMTSYAIGFIKFHSFSSLHTWSNKLTGILLAMTPLFLLFIDINITGIILGSVALLSAIEELAIIIRSSCLNRDIPYIFDKNENDHFKKY